MTKTRRAGITPPYRQHIISIRRGDCRASYALEELSARTSAAQPGPLIPASSAATGCKTARAAAAVEGDSSSASQTHAPPCFGSCAGAQAGCERPQSRASTFAPNAAPTGPSVWISLHAPRGRTCKEGGGTHQARSGA